MRRERPGDITTVEAVVRAAFGDEGALVARLVLALRESHAWRDLSFVAERDGEVVGHVLLTGAWLDAPRRLVDVLVLSPLAVVPAAQGAGVGSALVRHALEGTAGRAEPLVFLEGHPGFYPRFGFVPGGTRGFRPPSDRIPPAAFQVLVRERHEPWMAGALVYPDVFWRMDCVGLRGPEASAT
ncbi:MULTISPECIES: GNAT family N-acetyltransferase [unclassified Isoptericola]|uniref:GNAT family N-acetyltransferase n=1 Tax=unclassified Isoptericola TaxID=2623355 RepID=UPI00364D9859